MKIEHFNMPWNVVPLNEWHIAGMNHYFVKKEKYLHVVMVKDKSCIEAEGIDNKVVWEKLIRMAIKQQHKEILGAL